MKIHWGLKVFFNDIKVAHSLFALPFGILALLMLDSPRFPSGAILLALLGSILAARSYAMGMNRYWDRHIDALNPRTQGRGIPKGDYSAIQALGWSLCCGAGFIFFAFFLGVGVWSFPILLFLGGYGLMKRVTVFCHLYLGLCLGLCPLGVAKVLQDFWWSSNILALSLGVMLWTAGFDVIYSHLDLSVDKDQGLYSIPSRWGEQGAFIWTFSCFSFASLAFFLAGFWSEAAVSYYGSLGVVIFLFGLQLWFLKVPTAQRLEQAFFPLNSGVGWILLLGYALPFLT